MKRKKHKKRKVWPIILVVLTVLIVMAAAAVFLFRTRSYKVEGNSYYGERTITTWIENDPLSVNSLYVLYKYNFTDADLPSGVESLSISLKDPWTVKVKVKEKEMAGYVDYDGAYLYFDRTGTAVLRTKKIIEGVPHIEGLMFDSAKAKIGKKLPVEDDSIFEKIVEVSKNLKKYNLTPDRMGCTDGGVQIYFEIVQVSLGNGNYEEKLRQVEPILKKLTELYPGKAGVLHLENYDAESESIPVQDNGAGFDVKEYFNSLEQAENGSSREKIGLKNVDLRLRHIYGEEYRIKIKSKINTGTTIYIKIPIEEREENV